MIGLAMLISGCMTERSSLCPPLKKYTNAEQAELLKEKSALSSSSILVVAINDYGTLREACRIVK